MLLDSDIILKGRWFIQEEYQVHGELKFSPESRIELELLGTFHGFDVRLKGVTDELIYGILDNGSEVTLYNCFLIGHSSNVKAQYTKTKYSVNMVFVGHHFEEKDLVFTKFRFGLKNFDSWLGKTGLSFNGNGINEFGVNFKRPNTTSFKIGKIEGSFLSGYKTNTKEGGISLTEYSNIELIQNKGFTMEEIFQNIGILKSFLALLTYEPTYLMKLSLFNDKVVHEEKVLKGKTKEISVIWRDFSYYKSTKELLSHNMIMAFKHIEENLPLLLNNWFKYYSEIKPAFNLLFYSFRKSLIFTEEFFMDMARAVEVWHRRVIDSQIMLPSDFEKLITNTLANETLNEDEKQIIQGALAYANEPSLKGRLEDMLREYGFIFNFKESERKMFVKNVANSRNYYTHYDHRRESTALKDMELYDLAINLRALLISAILTKIGVNKELIKRRVNDILAQWQ